MNIVFRVDASVQMGTGHVMRCLALASELKAHGANVSFICRTLEGHLCELIEREGYQVFRLPQAQNNEYIEKLTSHSHWLEVNWRTDAEQTIQIIKDIQTVDWIIIDHYAIEKQWEEVIRPYVKKIMVIDDLADRKHECDLILDQNFYMNMETRYSHLVPIYCKQLLGPKYSLLRPEFNKARIKLKNRDGKVKRLLVFMGGSDPENVTEKVLKAISYLNNLKIEVDVIVGSNNKNKERIKKICENHLNFHYYYQVENIEEFMLNADLSIGAGGTTTWERCHLGLPSIVLTIASNQEEISQNLADKQCIIYLGRASEVTEKELSLKLKELINNDELLLNISKNAMQMVDGLGRERIRKIMYKEMKKFNITIVSDLNSWINKYIPELISKIKKEHNVNWVHDINDIPNGDFVFYLGCGRIVPSEILARNKHNLVVHESDLPKGKGWSPLTWQILEGENEIPIVLFEAVEKVDSGKVYAKDVMKFNGLELVDELREKQAQKSMQLCLKFIQEYPEIVDRGKEQVGKSTYYRRRTPEDSRLDPDKTIREQFNLLRVVDNERYPAFFEIDGEKYILKIIKERTSKNNY
jgi:UDP-2,4-diacetamido-2,4,6-trideoxy-beta-L-altropyranose hydrolase